MHTDLTPYFLCEVEGAEISGGGELHHRPGRAEQKPDRLALAVAQPGDLRSQYLARLHVCELCPFPEYGSHPHEGG